VFVPKLHLKFPFHPQNKLDQQMVFLCRWVSKLSGTSEEQSPNNRVTLGEIPVKKTATQPIRTPAKTVSVPAKNQSGSPTPVKSSGEIFFVFM
jgi:hypothetical protein